MIRLSSIERARMSLVLASKARRETDGMRVHLLNGGTDCPIGEMHRARRQCTPGLRGYQTMMEVSRTLRMTNQERLPTFRSNSRTRLASCAHDPIAFERVAAGRPL